MRQRYYLQSWEHLPIPFDLSPLKNVHFPKRQKHVPRGRLAERILAYGGGATRIDSGRF